ncbi:MAG: helix-turn-helix domain-containing protein [Pseudomonadota bacterium]
MELFWRQGYADTSMAQIVKETGLNRYALYSMFEDKRALFLATLALYFERCSQVFEPIITDQDRPPLDRLRLSMKTWIAMQEARRNGCLMCQVAVDQAQEDPAIAQAVDGYFQEILNMIAIPLREAADQLNPNLTPETAAQLVFDCEMSIGTHARAGAPHETLMRISDVTMAALTAPGVTWQEHPVTLSEDYR